MAASPPRRVYLDGDERRAQILSVAARLFSRAPYEAVSTADIAREAEIARGLVHHYFGSKRALYLEVLRRIFRVPSGLQGPVPTDENERREVLARAVDRWLDAAESNRATWLAAAGARGVGHDPEVDAIYETARAQISDRLIALSWGGPGPAPGALHALLRGYSGFAEAVTADWLLGRRLSRAQAHTALLHALCNLVDDVLPRVERAGDDPHPVPLPVDARVPAPLSPPPPRSSGVAHAIH